ncbi:hypothetical protein KL942_005121 [Ogataea angusta]|uniref:Uncharacterized protein n=1 Tax=Pichia angusta TaxID=870730 RepID=A0ABQ7RQ31_PICAN|nr:hypothetical protein KL942_005121 [Ogataea angusta]KAG7845681.1 hypothetical protein KL940_005081 [Ogataea angusta]
MSDNSTPEPQATSTANTTPIKGRQSRAVAKQTAEKLLTAFAEVKTAETSEEEPGNDRVILDETPVKKETRGRKPKNWVPPPGYTAKKKSSNPPSKTVIDDDLYRTLEQEYYQEPTPLASNPWHQRPGVKSTHQGETRVLHFHALNESYARKFQLGRDLMEPNIFHVNDELVQSYPFEPLKAIPDGIADSIEEKIAYEVVCSRVNLTVPVKFGFNDGVRKLLKAEGYAQYPTNSVLRQGFVVNTGGVPLVSSFLNKPIDGKHYLFVSVIDRAGTDTSVRKELSICQPQSYDAALQVYEVDLDKQTVNHKKTMVIPFGAITSMKWLLSSGPEDSLLACVCKDGVVRVLRIDKRFVESGPYSCLVAPSVLINIPEFDIFSCDWTSNTTLVLGLRDGYLAEVNITKPEKPLFVFGLDVEHIISVTSTYSDSLFGAPSRIVVISATDFYYYLVDLDNMRVIAESQKAKVPCTQIQYSALIDGFVIADATKTPKFVSKKDIQSYVTLNLWDDNQVFSIGVSDFAPFFVAGYVNGSVRLYNPIRRIHSTAKLKVAPASLRLMKMDVSKDEFRLDLSYVATSESKDVESHSIYDNRINVTSCALANTPSCSGLMACSFANGLVAIERILSAKSI